MPPRPSPGPGWEAFSEHATTDSSDREVDEDLEDEDEDHRSSNVNAIVEKPGLSMKRKENDHTSGLASRKRPRVEGGAQPKSSAANGSLSIAAHRLSAVAGSSIAGPSRLFDAISSRLPESSINRPKESSRHVESTLKHKHAHSRAEDWRMGESARSISTSGLGTGLGVGSRPSNAIPPNPSQSASSSTKPRPPLPSRMTQRIDKSDKNASTANKSLPPKPKAKSTPIPPDVEILEISSTEESPSAAAKRKASKKFVKTKVRVARKDAGERKGPPEIIEILDSDEESAKPPSVPPSTSTTSSGKQREPGEGRSATEATASASHIPTNYRSRSKDAMDVDPRPIRRWVRPASIQVPQRKYSTMGELIRAIEGTKDGRYRPSDIASRTSAMHLSSKLEPLTPALKTRPSTSTSSPTSPSTKKPAINRQGLNPATVPAVPAPPIPPKHKLQMGVKSASNSKAHLSPSSASGGSSDSGSDDGRSLPPEGHAASDVDIDMRNLSDALGLATSLGRPRTPQKLSQAVKQPLISPRLSGASGSRKLPFSPSSQVARKTSFKRSSVNGIPSAEASTTTSPKSAKVNDNDTATTDSTMDFEHAGNDPAFEDVIRTSQMIIGKLRQKARVSSSVATGESSLLRSGPGTPSSNSESVLPFFEKQASPPPGSPTPPLQTPSSPVSKSPASRSSPDSRPQFETRHRSAPAFREPVGAPSALEQSPTVDKSPTEKLFNSSPSTSRHHRPLSMSSIPQQSLAEGMSEKSHAAITEAPLPLPPTTGPPPPISPKSIKLSQSRASALPSPSRQQQSFTAFNALSSPGVSSTPSSAFSMAPIESQAKQPLDLVHSPTASIETMVRDVESTASVMTDPCRLFNDDSEDETMREADEVQALIQGEENPETASPPPILSSNVEHNDLDEGGPSRPTRRSSRSSVGEEWLVPPDQEYSAFESLPSSRPGTPPLDDSAHSRTEKTYGGFSAITWKQYRHDLKNFSPECKHARDLPHALHDHINSMSAYTRMMPNMRDLFEAMVLENTVEDEPDAPPIELQNTVDEEPTPPWEFYYTNKMWHGEEVPPPDVKNLLSCSCKGICNPRSKTCACLKRQREAAHDPNMEFAYDKSGKLKIPGYPIFECNDLCGCGDECRNRVVQHGRTVSVAIRKTQHKGWGVFATKKIPERTFIGIYSGELLTDKEAHERGIKYNKWGRTYLFDLDFHHLRSLHGGEWTNKFTVDAYHAGNFTRFLNHSCDPNSRLYPCYINEGNIEKPLLVIFSRRDVEANEEICFNYQGKYPGDDDDDDEQDEQVAEHAATERDLIYESCMCGAAICTGVMFN